ncbi:MAG: plasmid partitioning protein RepB C-terminal domain-containing protein [Pirellulales bacterium]
MGVEKMTEKVNLACGMEVLEIPLENILPTRLMDDSIRKSPKYLCIEASIKELGLIEPLMIHPQDKAAGTFLLLDGTIRHRILKDLGFKTAKCLISSEDEGFTYNHKINRLMSIQEHFMILKAIKDGLDEERIAKTLNVDVASIRQKRDLLEGVCSEAVHLLRDKPVTANGLREFRKVKSMRQIEIAELLCAAHNFSHGYVKCLIAASKSEEMIDPEKGKEIKGLSPEDIARMEHEMESLGREYRLIEESHGLNTLNLVLVVNYLKKLLDNPRVLRFLMQRYPEMQVELQKLSELRSLGEPALAKTSAG